MPFSFDMSRKKFNEKPIFFDESGKRWLKIKIGFGFLIATFLAVILLIAGAIFWQPKGFLLKIAGDSNFDVIDNISTQVKETIIVGGAGTFIKISPDHSSKKPKYNIQRTEETKGKVIALTFDDGPSPVYTEQILSILKKENVSATFFLVGEDVLKYPGVAKTLVRQGQEIGNHTFSHAEEGAVDYSNPKNSPRLDYELNFAQSAIIAKTGIKTKLFRAPYWGVEDKISMDTLAFSTFALDRGYLMSSPTLNSFDYQEKTTKKIIQNSTAETGNPVVLLMHDGGGDREKTIQALPSIINFYKSKGYRFAKLSDLVAQPTMVQPGVFEDVSSNVAILSYEFLRKIPLILNPIFLFGLAFTLVYSSSVILLSLLELFRSNRLKRTLRKNYWPAVTVLVPAYNEEKVIGKTIKSILASDYPNFKILVIDDGSTDNTLTIAKSFETDTRVRVLHKENGGKFSALNFGLQHVQTEVYIAIDADTQVVPNTISNLARFFQVRKIGAVAGNVKVGNRKNLLGSLQSIEYIMSLNLERNAYSFLNSILVVPGALGAWRTKAVQAVGGYLGNTLTEDAELTLRILREGFRLVYDKDSVAYTEAPATPTQLIKQRFRWTFGIFQTLFSHKDLIFKKKHSFLGFIVLPFTIFVQVPIMLLTPLMDILAFYYIFFISAKMVATYLIFYLAIRTFLAVVAFGVSKESPWPLIFMPFQRIYYQPILYVALYQSVILAFRGSTVTWRKLDHCGSVSI